MKNFYCLFFLSFFFFSKKGISQTQPLLDKLTKGSIENNQYSKQFEYEYFYDDLGDTLQINVNQFDSNGDSELFGTFFQYDSQKRIISKTFRRYNPDVDLWITIVWEEYLYEGDCLIQIKKYRNSRQGLIYYDYEVDSNCKIVTSIIDSSLIAYQSYEYPDTNNSVISYDYFLNNNEWELGYLKEVIYNDRKDLVRRYELVLNNLDTAFERIIENEYTYVIDPTTNQLTSKIRKLYSTIFPSSEIHFRYIDTTDYQYTCDGFVKEVKRKGGSIPAINHVDYYQYQGKSECFDYDQNFELDISPNPSNGIINIQSNIFESGNSYLRVMTNDGQLIRDQYINFRTTSQEIELSFLPNGIYIIQVISEERFKIGKLVIMN